jgi:hypothetical protein
MSASRESTVRNLGTFLALFALLLMSGGLLALVAVVLPQALGLLLILGGFVFVVAFHYLTWGWWMSIKPAPVDVEEEDEEF